MIVSRQNQKLKNIRRLIRCKGDRALIEGPHLIHDALKAELSLETVLATPQFLTGAEGPPLLDSLGYEPELIADHLLDDLCDADSPKGVIAVVSLPRGGTSEVPVKEGSVVVFIDGMQDPGNLGALARVSEAFGAEALALAPGSVHPNHPRALRASAGSLLRVPVATSVEASDLDRHLEAVSPRWIALAPRDGQPLADAPVSGSLVMAIGSEGPGLSPAVLDRADHVVTIATKKTVESLNVTVAAALVLYERSRRRTD